MVEAEPADGKVIFGGGGGAVVGWAEGAAPGLRRPRKQAPSYDPTAPVAAPSDPPVSFTKVTQLDTKVTPTI